MMKRTILSFLLIFANPLLHAESSSQSLDLIKEKIEQYVVNALSNQSEGKIKVSAEKIDSRLKLKKCHKDNLEVFNPYQTPLLRTTTMGIRCQESANHWTLYVPINITLQKAVLIAKHSLLKGTQVSAEDVDLLEMDVSQLKQGYFSKINDIIGQVCKQNIAQGSTFTAYNLQTALLIRKGEQVTIQAVNDMINVSMEGIALNDGSIGDMIKVKNLTSKRIVEAQVSARKQVRITI